MAHPSGFVLDYYCVPDMLQKRTPFLPLHAQHILSYLPRGLLSAGPTVDPYDGGIFIWSSAASEEIIEQFVRTDPYFTAGLVTRYEVREFEVQGGALKPSFE
jgi:uncharacterized protein YciI